MFVWDDHHNALLLPDLHKVEEAFSVEHGVAVIGVHSAKFKNERVSANILNAMLRYGITHPVVNDHEAVLWNQMNIQCWPTFVIVGPDGNCLLYLVGEGHGKLLLEFVTKAVQLYKKQGNSWFYGCVCNYVSYTNPVLFYFTIILILFLA